MKVRFAILSAISFWLYTTNTLVVNVIEKVVFAKLVESGASFSNADYVIDITTCQKMLLAVAGVFMCFFIVDNIFGFIEGHKDRDNQSMARQK